MATQTFDYIIVGGGTAGCVVASRLKEKNPTLSIVIVEAGPDVSKHPLVPDAADYPQLLGSELDWNYTTVPQKHLDGRSVSNHAGRALGGSSVTNAGEFQKVVICKRPVT
jgi:choline dehydrogenase-like flavoprotein